MRDLTQLEIVQRTKRLDLTRGIPLGYLLPMQSSVLLTIAIKQHNAPGWAKGLIAGAGGIGLLLTPFVTALARHVRVPVMRLAGWIMAVAAIGFLLASIGGLSAYVLGAVIAVAVLDALAPLNTVMFQQNYPPSDIGKLVSRGMSVKVATSIGTGLLVGWFLSEHPNRWWLVTVVAALCALAVVGAQMAMPSVALAPVAGRRNRPWPRLGLLRDNLSCKSPSGRGW